VAPVWYPPAEPRKFEQAGDPGHLATQRVPKAPSGVATVFSDGL